MATRCIVGLEILGRFIVFLVANKLHVLGSDVSGAFEDTLVITAWQNLQEVYVDGEPRLTSNGDNSSTPDYLPMSTQTRLVAAFARNLGQSTCVGILATSYPRSLVTNKKWKCAESEITNWFELGFDDSSWSNAVEYGDNLNGHSNCTKTGKVVDLSPDAKWIWGGNLERRTVYCRGYTSYCETVSPCQNGGTCLNNNRTLCQCLPQFAGKYCETRITNEEDGRLRWKGQTVNTDQQSNSSAKIVQTRIFNDRHL